MTVVISKEEYEKELQALQEKIEARTGKTTQQLYEEREKRITDAIALEIPDRVPLLIDGDIQAYSGVPNSSAYYDPIAYKRAMRNFAIDFEPDFSFPGLPMSGHALALLQVQNRLWPGGPLPPNYEMQFIEGEFMKEDEYDHLLSDPADFVIRKYLPRVYKVLQPLEDLPPLDMMFQGFEGLTTLFTSPEFLKMAKALAEAGQFNIDFRETIGDSYGELVRLGFPPLGGFGNSGIGGAPFDTVSSFLRGMEGSMIDMYRRPEKLLQLCEMILDRKIARGIPYDANRMGNSNRLGMPLWRGDKFFMSETHFDQFYWPGLKRALQANIDLGYVPSPVFEAEFGTRLERLLELPRARMAPSIEHVDMKIAREALADHCCVMVRIPHSAKLWSLTEIESYVKEIIDLYRGCGGLIISVKVPDVGKIEDIQAMLESIREYSRN